MNSSNFNLQPLLTLGTNQFYQFEIKDKIEKIEFYNDKVEVIQETTQERVRVLSHNMNIPKFKSREEAKRIIGGSWLKVTQNEDGSWSVRNDNAKVNIDFLNPNIKYCEIKYLEENSTVFTDGQTHHSSRGDTKTWKTKIVECTGDDYSICPVDSSKGELLKHPCGEIDNFAEATSILMAIDEAVDALEYYSLIDC